MAYSQQTEDWNKRFLQNDTPWKDKNPSQEMERLFGHFISPGSSVLEVGCGEGINGIYLSSMGFDYHGIDISEEALREARFNAKTQNSNAEFFQKDFMKDGILEKEYDVIFDKGLMHTFRDAKYRDIFVEKCASSIKEGGFWINISGNKDNPDNPEDIEKYGYPRLKASEIISNIEGKFQLHYMARCIYGDKDGNANFLGWAIVMQKR